MKRRRCRRCTACRASSTTSWELDMAFTRRRFKKSKKNVPSWHQLSEFRDDKPSPARSALGAPAVIIPEGASKVRPFVGITFHIYVHVTHIDGHFSDACGIDIFRWRSTTTGTDFHVEQGHSRVATKESSRQHPVTAAATAYATRDGRQRGGFSAVAGLRPPPAVMSWTIRVSATPTPLLAHPTSSSECCQPFSRP